MADANEPTRPHGSGAPGAKRSGRSASGSTRPAAWKVRLSEEPDRDTTQRGHTVDRLGVLPALAAEVPGA